jgi:glycosyltransferase involved in cell wall biosynthesis
MKKITVSIGIPAYNEQANIKKLLLSLLAQKGDNFTLKEIIVVSDCSIDNTDQEVKTVKSKLITHKRNKNRMGIAYGQNKIIKFFSGEILILLNADILVEDPKFIDYLVQPFRTNKNIGLVSPKVQPLRASNFFEKMINFSVECREAMLQKWNDGDNALHCQGLARAFNQKLAKNIEFSSSVGEDAFSYFKCLMLGFHFKYQKKTTVYYRSPNNYGDFKNQSYRFLNSQKIMANFFGQSKVKQAYHIPLDLELKAIFIFLFKNPVYWVFYATIFLYFCITSNQKKYTNPVWDIASSSKVLK